MEEGGPWSVDVEPHLAVGFDLDGVRRFNVTQVSLLEPGQHGQKHVTVFLDTGHVRLVLGTLSAERPALAVPPATLQLEYLFCWLLHDSTDGAVRFRGYLSYFPLVPEDPALGDGEVVDPDEWAEHYEGLSDVESTAST